MLSNVQQLSMSDPHLQHWYRHATGKKRTKKVYWSIIIWYIFNARCLVVFSGVVLLQEVWWYGLICFLFWTLLILTGPFLMQNIITADVACSVFIIKCLLIMSNVRLLLMQHIWWSWQVCIYCNKYGDILCSAVFRLFLKKMVFTNMVCVPFAQWKLLELNSRSNS